MTKVVCDSCSTEIKVVRYKMELHTSKYVLPKKLDLCGTCADKLDAHVEAFLNVMRNSPLF